MVYIVVFSIVNLEFIGLGGTSGIMVRKDKLKKAGGLISHI